MKHGRLILILGVLLSAAGCQTWREVPQGNYENSKHQFSAQVAEGWMNLGRAPYFLMTKDGVALDYIAVSRHQMADELEYTKKKFMAGMTPSEVAEVDLDDIRLRAQVGGFELISQDPATIDGHPGYRLHYRYITKEGLRVKGFHVGFVHEDWVYRIQYEAAAQHYFDAYRSDFETFLKDFKVF